jgi:hypothetical protein
VQRLPTCGQEHLPQAKGFPMTNLALRALGTLMLATLFGAALTLLAADAACQRLRR